ncbi:MAG: hypothetical protein HYY84_04395 [Deltaproteobacteria bacterium]|nr:hypothetical protein [Deltaproteobacteria bacterium]
MAVPVRGIQDVKTLGFLRGSGAHGKDQHVFLFRLATLELERTRRLREREAAVKRMNAVDARLVEVERLIQNQQEALGVTRNRAQAGNAARALATAGRARRVLRYGR